MQFMCMCVCVISIVLGVLKRYCGYKKKKTSTGREDRAKTTEA